ncbi:MAG: YigZ family protein [Monoglobales bacterium]
MSSSEYKTVKDRGYAEFTDKKSLFISNVFPVKTEEKAIFYLNAVKKKYSDATHNVYAYVVRENNIQRFSDDGEPSGTAGMPVLDAIRKRGLTDMLVVVTRYFGGTLLGTGGLVHAYGKSASLGIENACPVTRRLCHIYSVTADYSLSGKIEYSLTGSEYIIENIDYTDAVTFKVCVPFGAEERFLKEVTEVSLGSAKVEGLGERFVDI